MTKNLANVDITSDTFAAWLAKTNQMLESFRHDVVTVSNTTLSTTTGNAALIGRFTADVLVANVSLRGGNNSTSANLSIISQLNVSNAVVVQNIKVDNGTTNVIIQSPSAVQIANNGFYLNANGSWAYIDLTTFSGTANNANYLGGVAAANYLTNTAAATISGVHTHTANLGIRGLLANGSLGTDGQFLRTNGSNVYWASIVGLTLPGSNSHIIYNNNSDFGANASFYFVSANATVVVGNSTVNGTYSNSQVTLANSSTSMIISYNQIRMGNTTENSVVNSVMHTVGANLFVNSSAIFIGNTTANVTVNTFFTTSNSSGTSYLRPNGLGVAGLVVNTVGAFMNTTTKISIGGDGAAYSQDWTFEVVKNQNNITKMGFHNANTGLSAAVVQQFTTGTGFSYMQMGLFDNAGTPAFQIALGSSVQYFQTIANSYFIGNATSSWIIANTTAITLPNQPLVVNNNIILLSNTTSNTRLTIPTTVERAGNYFLHANGAWVALYGKTAIPIPASAMSSRTTNGAAFGTHETATNFNMHNTYDFDGTGLEYVQFVIPMPSSWNEGTISFKPIVSKTSGGSGTGTTWKMQAVAFGNNESSNAAFGTSQSSVVTLTSANTIYVGPESSAITVAGSPAAGEMVMFQVFRDPADASDNVSIDARLHGVHLFITVDTTVDT